MLGQSREGNIGPDLGSITSQILANTDNRTIKTRPPILEE